MVQELKDISLQRGGGGGHPASAARAAAAAAAAAVPASRLDPDGLIMPKKIPNPCTESREAMDLNREIRWNAKT